MRRETGPDLEKKIRRKGSEKVGEREVSWQVLTHTWTLNLQLYPHRIYIIDSNLTFPFMPLNFIQASSFTTSCLAS